jgi:hypothetical protein
MQPSKAAQCSDVETLPAITTTAHSVACMQSRHLPAAHSLWACPKTCGRQAALPKSPLDVAAAPAARLRQELHGPSTPYTLPKSTPLRLLTPGAVHPMCAALQPTSAPLYLPGLAVAASPAEPKGAAQRFPSLPEPWGESSGTETVLGDRSNSSPLSREAKGLSSSCFKNCSAKAKQRQRHNERVS